MQHLPVPSRLIAIYADSETALKGPAQVFTILTEINSNGFPGAGRESDRQTNDLSEVEANRNGAGGGQKRLDLNPELCCTENMEQVQLMSLFKYSVLRFIGTKFD